MSKASSVVVGEDGTVKVIGPRATRVFYIGVGNLSRASAEKHLREFQKRMNDNGIDHVFYENIYIGIQETNDTKVEVFPWCK
jgi:hypothetical protein